MMEMVLEAKDAGDWIYRGEGAANIVLSYKGKSPQFVGKVLRVPKVKKNGSESEGPSVLSPHECLLWKDTSELLSAPTREIAEHLYVQHVMSPLLGPDHIDAGVRVVVSREFLELVGKKILIQRPSWRIDAAEVNSLCNSVLLISDHSVFPLGICKEEFSISVELKPKCGFLPLSRFIVEENAIKKGVTRFKMHQALKLRQRKISELSEYDPLDLFAGSKGRVLKSIKDLYRTPQNNFRVFLNGTIVFGGSGDCADITNRLSDEAFEDALKSVIQADDGMRITNFLQLIAEAVYESGLLSRLLDVQKLDVYDIEGAIHAYYNVVSEPCMVCRKLSEKNVSAKYASLHSIPFDESLKIVREYLIAATAKDLSLIFSFRSREKGASRSPYRAIFLESTGQSFDYKASFIDLDMKPLEKMVHYYELDQRIVSCYTQMVNTVNQPDNFASILDTSYRDQSSTAEDAFNARDSAVNGA